jgi:hypothetical protein
MGGSLAQRIRSGSALVLVGLGGGLAEPALANRQLDEKEGTLEQVEKDANRARAYEELVDLRLYGGSNFTIGSDYDEFRATSYQPNGRLKVTLPVANNAALRMILRGSALLTDFDDVSTNLFGTPTTSDPFGNLYATSLQIQGGLRPGWSGLFTDEERWSLLAEGQARARWEEDASFDSSLTGGGSLGVGYQIGDWLEVLIGAGVETRMLRSGISIRPVFEVDWRFAEHWRVRTRGRGLQVEYDVNDDLSLFASGQMESRSFLTADRGPGIGEGRLRESGIPVGLGVRWDVRSYLELTLTGGAVLRQEIRAQDHNRNDLGHVRAGPAPYLGLTLEFRPDRLRRREAVAQKSQGLGGGASSSTSISTSR